VAKEIWKKKRRKDFKDRQTTVFLSSALFPADNQD